MASRDAIQETGIGTFDDWMSHARLRELSLRAATGLFDLGVERGDVVAVVMRNDLPFMIASAAANICGAYAVPVNWHLSPPEVEYILKDSAAKVVVAHADLLKTFAHLVPDGVHVIAVETPARIVHDFHIADSAARPRAGERVWHDWVEGFAPWDGPAVPSPGSLIYTSGTTGVPKGVKRVPLDAEGQARNYELFRSVYGVGPDMRSLISTPLYHASPNSFSRHASANSEFLLMVPKFDAEETLRLIEKHRINVLTTAPAVFVRLLKLPKTVRDKYDVSSLRWVSHTASACPADVKLQMIDWWGPILHETYGGTETGAALYCDTPNWLTHKGTVGRPVNGCEIRLYGDDGEIVPQGTPGEIYVKNSVFPDFTYLNHDDKRAEIDRDGFVSIGDVGYQDQEGFLYLCDRKSDMVNFAGTNVYPAEIESALIQHDGVMDCAVIGVPDPDYGEVLFAYVIAKEGHALTPEDLQVFLKTRLASYKVPKRYAFVPVLPREESGKIMKRKLMANHR